MESRDTRIVAEDSLSPNLYQLIGGKEACRSLVVAFYGRVAKDPTLAHLYSTNLKCPIDSLTYFFTQFLGDSDEYSRNRFHLSLRESHERFKIGQSERDAWLANMVAALDDIKLGEPARSALRQFFTSSSTFMINHPAPPGETAGAEIVDATFQKAEDSDLTDIEQEIGFRWRRRRVAEEIVSAIRQRDAKRALALIDTPIMQSYPDRLVRLGLLAMMGGSGETSMFEYVSQKLAAESQLATESYTYSRILLHDAARDWSPEFTTLLLNLGANPNAEDKFGHTPLYYAGNVYDPTGARNRDNGKQVVALLARAGAALNTRSGPKKCSALHMAARRGNLGIAEALLDCGAGLEVRDSAGETPLRRAVNCGQTEMVGLLISRGADLHSIGSKGLTPLDVARGKVKQMLQAHIKG